jgi:TrmH family RNA methyltransferase
MEVKSSPDGIDRDRVRFVLVEPLAGGNIGSAARALKNLGFRRLELVRPRCDPLGPEATQMAVDAADVLRRATVHDDLDGALAGAATVAGTSRRKGKYRTPHYPLDHFAGELVRSTAAGELAVVFGREDHGLADAELDRCTHLVYLPASDRYASFNLSQAVLLVAYELCRAATGTTPEEWPEPPADHEEREAMYQHLQRALLAIGFLQRDTTETMMRRLRRLLGRAALRSEEVKIFRGIARQSLWIAQHGGKSVPLPEDDEP